MSEYSPTFVNWDKEASRPVGGGMFERKASPAATDLHIVFNKGGVTVKDKGKEADGWEYGDTRRNSVDLTFPDDKPINSSPYQPPASLQPNGTVVPAPQPLPGTFTTPTFTHNDPKFPGIKEWWWTVKNRRSSPVFRGNPKAEAPKEKRPKKE